MSQIIDEINDHGVCLNDGTSLTFTELGQIIAELGQEAPNIVRDKLSAGHIADNFKETARILDAIASLPHLFAKSA